MNRPDGVVLCTRLRLDGLRLPVRIGIRAGENDLPQPVLLTVHLDIRRGPASGAGAFRTPWGGDGPGAKFGDVVCTDTLAARLRGIAAGRVWGPVEELADALVEGCLADDRVLRVVLRVQKPDTVDAAVAAGIEVEARRAGFRRE